MFTGFEAYVDTPSRSRATAVRLRPLERDIDDGSPCKPLLIK
jgi:hypothetical protein